MLLYLFIGSFLPGEAINTCELVHQKLGRVINSYEWQDNSFIFQFTPFATGNENTKALPFPNSL